jgi:hypothetical protein
VGLRSNASETIAEVAAVIEGRDSDANFHG